MKTFILIVLISLMSGCMLTSGQTEYSLKPIETASGEIICCEAYVYNTKDYDKLKFKFVRNADGSMTVTLDESGVSASTPQMIQAENNAKLLDAVTAILPQVVNK